MMPLDPDPLTVLWHPQLDDLVGGWCVMAVDMPPSRADPRRGQHQVASFLSEPIARHVAELHNATLTAQPGAGHVYLSTACLHGEHDYCNAMVGYSGKKRPGRCKFCDSPCVCPACHDAGAP